jgi:hypothetical protein
MLHGVSQGHRTQCGANPILFIYVNHIYNIRYAHGRGSNTIIELSTLWVLLFMVNYLNMRKLQIVGYSKVVVERVKGKQGLQAVGLNALNY